MVFQNGLREDKMKSLKMILLIIIAGLSAAILSSVMTGDGVTSMLTVRSVEAQTKLPLYKPPVHGSVARRIEAGTRGTEDAVPSLFVLAPDGHVGLTLQEQPSLYWYLSKDSKYPVEVTLIDSQGINPLIETELSPPLQAGVQRIRLVDYEVRLAPKERYQWSVALIPDPQNRSQDVLSSGFIERIESNALPAANREQLKLIKKANPTDKPRIYAEVGLWYDALSTLGDLIDTPPKGITPQELRQQRAALLEQVNLEEVAAYDRQAK
jgi:hypothetical protein